MRFNINNIGLVLCAFLLTSCVYTKFEVYKSFENIETDTRYYKVEEKDGVYKWVEIGIHTIFGAGRKDYLTVSFKEELPKNLTIKSSNFGNIDNTHREDYKEFSKRINIKDIKSDTVYLEFNDNKRYKFYYDFEEK
jgi:lipoprotein